METLLGALIWGGLLLLLLWWLGGRGTTPPSDSEGGSSTWTSRSSPSAAAPTPRPSTAPLRSAEQGQRETEALVDGLVIGHYLTRDHERRRAAERAEELERERDRAQAAASLIGDEVTHDLPRSDAVAEDGFDVAGFDVEGFAAPCVDADGFDELDAYDDPQGFASEGWGEDDEFDDDEW